MPGDSIIEAFKDEKKETDLSLRLQIAANTFQS